MTDKREVYVVDIIDSAKLSPFQIAVFVLFGMFLVMDGFDVQSIGYVAPALIDEWDIPTPVMRWVFTSGLLGLFIGSMFLGMLGDRIGRRRVLLSATATFSVFTLACAAARSPTELMVIRFFAGLGLGAILPNATALIGEFSPQRIRVATMMIVTNGFTVGAMIGGFLSAWLIPEYGWRAVFYVGGAVPLLLGLAIVVPILGHASWHLYRKLVARPIE